MEVDTRPLSDTNLVRLSCVRVAPTRPLRATWLFDRAYVVVNRSTAGVLCFAVEPKTQNIFLLLGRETCFPDMHAGSGQWCDFGGALHPGESVTTAAAREFTEESIACVSLGDQTPGRLEEYEEKFRGALRRREYLCRIDVALSGRDKTCQRTYFVKEVPWQPDIRTAFSSVRNQLCQVRRLPRLSNCPFSLRKHPAVQLRQHRVVVDAHYLEKQCVNWWSLDRLTEVVRNNGRFKTQRFRRTFLPALRIVIRKLRELYAV